MPFLDGTTLDAAMECLDDALLDGLGDSQWAVRDVAISSLATFVSTSFDEDHELLLTDATCKLFGQPACKSTESKLFGLPRKAIHALKLGGGVSGLGDAAAGSVDASAIAPTPYVSPAFEVRVSVLHALRVIGQTSPSCRDAALLMMMMAVMTGWM